MDPLSLLAGIIIGLIPAAAVELSLKPRRTRSNVARALRIEVALNLKLLALQSAYRARQPMAIPGDFTLSKTAFEAVASEIGELVMAFSRDGDPGHVRQRTRGSTPALRTKSSRFIVVAA